MRIDAHQHFWKFDPIRDNWISDEMAVLKNDFLPENLEPVLKANGLNGCVVVQSSQSEEENIFQLQNANANDFIKGIVGWVDLRAENIEERLAYYSAFPKIKGFRHVLQGEPQRDIMLSPNFMNGISKLEHFGFTYDILIFPDQLPYIPELVAAFPNQKFVLNHIAKPNIKQKKILDWEKYIQLVAQYDNVSCKISGMVTEADWSTWQAKDFVPYLDMVVNSFGMSRVIFGSDWPVCLVASSYQKIMDIVNDYFVTFSKTEQAQFFGLNAINFYGL